MKSYVGQACQPSSVPMRLALVTVLASGCLCACHHNYALERTRFDGYVKDYIRLAVALGERDVDSLDFYFGSADLVSDVRTKPPALAGIKNEAATLADKIHADDQLPPDLQDRQKRLEAQLRAIYTRAAFLTGTKVTFDVEAKVYFGLTLQPADEVEDTDDAIDQLTKLLKGAGPLAKRYAEFDSQFIIPPDRLPAVLERAVQGCRAETVAHINLPPEEAVKIEYVSNKPWAGYSRYLGNYRSVFQVNTDLAMTIDRAVALACHETYPGHHVWNVLRERDFVRGQKWLEWTVQPTFSPQSLASEATATYAADLAFPEPERAHFQRDKLFTLTDLDIRSADKYEQVSRLMDELHVIEPAIARDFVDGKLEWARASQKFEDQGLMASADQTLKYLNEYRSYMLTYTMGLDLVQDLLDPLEPGARWKAYEKIILDPDASRHMTTPKITK